MACMFPITIENPAVRLDLTAMTHIPVPCGKCPTCLQTRANGWIFRLLQEDKVRSKAYFVTFTYENRFFTKASGRLTPSGYMTLVKYDWQTYMKHVRSSFRYRALDPLTNRMKYMYDKVPEIKYFMCGEYGSDTYRPHYHAIIFGLDEMDIRRHWTYGIVHIEPVNGNTVAYTCKYMNKGRLIPVHANDDRLPEFQLASKGLGASYITDQTIKYHNEDTTRTYLTAVGGVKFPMPKYYRQKIFSEETRRNQARRVQSIVLEEKEKKIADFVQENPADNYYRAEVERKKAALGAYRAQLKTRNKL